MRWVTSTDSSKRTFHNLRRSETSNALRTLFSLAFSCDPGSENVDGRPPLLKAKGKQRKCHGRQAIILVHQWSISYASSTISNHCHIWESTRHPRQAINTRFAKLSLRPCPRLDQFQELEMRRRITRPRYELILESPEMFLDRRGIPSQVNLAANPQQVLDLPVSEANISVF